MQRVKKIKEISIPDRKSLEAELMRISRDFKRVAILNSNQYADHYGKYELLAAFGSRREISADDSSFERLKEFKLSHTGWIFGHLSYELKDQLEDLRSEKEKQFSFPLLSFFEPLHLLVWKRGEDKASWYSWSEKELLDLIDHSTQASLLDEQSNKIDLRPTLGKADYLKRVEALKEEIRYGNIYEVNFCQSFNASGKIDPYYFANLLFKRSSMPFSAFYKQEDSYLICASPERFICKRGDKLICQPIKGTARRSEDPEEDKLIAEALRSDLKEQTENVMIVDLMRNDLSRTAARGSVKVEELFGVYHFPQVHQLISTISSKLADEYDEIEAIRLAFPMGSMTGAPKIKAMELIEKWEEERRELYSGTLGYFDPEGDFDFNVVIRSLIYSAEKKFASLTVGGAITDLSIAENEYQECLLKAKAIFEQSEEQQV